MSRPDQFADELRMAAQQMDDDAQYLYRAADRAQEAADEFDLLAEQHDELRAEVARMRPVIEAAQDWRRWATGSHQHEDAETRLASALRDYEDDCRARGGS